MSSFYGNGGGERRVGGGSTWDLSILYLGDGSSGGVSQIFSILSSQWHYNNYG